MLLKISILSIVLFIRKSVAHPRECENVASVIACAGEKNIELQYSPDDLTCQASEISRHKVRDDYTYTPGVGYHKFHTQAKNWNDARKVCWEEGGHLAIINSKKEHETINHMFRQNVNNIRKAQRNDQAWLGAHNLFASDDWVTVLGEPLSSSGYNRWGTGGPDNSGGNEHCLCILDNGEQGLNDGECARPLGFICEIPDECS